MAIGLSPIGQAFRSSPSLPDGEDHWVEELETELKEAHKEIER